MKVEFQLSITQWLIGFNFYGKPFFDFPRLSLFIGPMVLTFVFSK